jgi:hypothetical protein
VCGCALQWCQECGLDGFGQAKGAQFLLERVVLGGEL